MRERAKKQEIEQRSDDHGEQTLRVEASAVAINLVGTFPCNAGRIGPHHFKVVEFAGVGLEEMHDNIDKVGEQPGGAFIGVLAIRVVPLLLAQMFDILGNALHLTVGGAAADHDVVADLAQGLDVEDSDVITVIVVQKACCIDGKGSGIDDTSGIGRVVLTQVTHRSGLLGRGAREHVIAREGFGRFKRAGGAISIEVVVVADIILIVRRFDSL